MVEDVMYEKVSVFERARTCTAILAPQGDCSKVCEVSGGKVAQLSYSANVTGYDRVLGQNWNPAVYDDVGYVGTYYGPASRYKQINVSASLDGQSRAFDCATSLHLTIGGLPVSLPVEMKMNDGAGPAWEFALRDQAAFNTNEVINVTLGAKELPIEIPNEDFTDTSVYYAKAYVWSSGKTFNFWSVSKVTIDYSTLVLKEVTKFL